MISIVIIVTVVTGVRCTVRGYANWHRLHLKMHPRAKATLSRLSKSSTGKFADALRESGQIVVREPQLRQAPVGHDQRDWADRLEATGTNRSPAAQNTRLPIAGFPFRLSDDDVQVTYLKVAVFSF